MRSRASRAWPRLLITAMSRPPNSATPRSAAAAFGAALLRASPVVGALLMHQSPGPGEVLWRREVVGDPVDLQADVDGDNVSTLAGHSEGVRSALDLALTGSTLDAPTALSWGLVDQLTQH
jgi:hypothetical protein